MLKKPFLAIMFGSALLASGCNTNNDESVGDDDGVIEDAGEDIQEGVNEVEKDVEDAVDTTDDTLNENDNINDADNTPDTNGDKRILNDNDEDIIEDPKDVKDRDTIDE